MDKWIGLLVGIKLQWWRSGCINRLVGWLVQRAADTMSRVCVQIVLLGTDDGLFALNPHSTSGRQHLVQLSGFGSVHQIAEAKGINMVLLLTGTACALVTFLFFCFPSCLPSFLPSFLHSFLPSFLPSILPSFLLTLFPSLHPSFLLTLFPSLHPSILPSFLPSFLLTLFPFPCHRLFCSFSLFCVPAQAYLLFSGMVSHANHAFFWSCLQVGLDLADHLMINLFGEKGKMFDYVWYMFDTVWIMQPK